MEKRINFHRPFYDDSLDDGLKIVYSDDVQIVDSGDIEDLDSFTGLICIGVIPVIKQKPSQNNNSLSELASVKAEQDEATAEEEEQQEMTTPSGEDVSTFVDVATVTFNLNPRTEISEDASAQTPSIPPAADESSDGEENEFYLDEVSGEIVYLSEKNRDQDTQIDSPESDNECPTQEDSENETVDPISPASPPPVEDNLSPTLPSRKSDLEKSSEHEEEDNSAEIKTETEQIKQEQTLISIEEQSSEQDNIKINNVIVDDDKPKPALGGVAFKVPSQTSPRPSVRRSHAVSMPTISLRKLNITDLTQPVNVSPKRKTRQSPVESNHIDKSLKSPRTKTKLQDDSHCQSDRTKPDTTEKSDKPQGSGLSSLLRYRFDPKRAKELVKSKQSARSDSDSEKRETKSSHVLAATKSSPLTSDDTKSAEPRSTAVPCPDKSNEKQIEKKEPVKEKDNANDVQTSDKPVNGKKKLTLSPSKVASLRNYRFKLKPGAFKLKKKDGHDSPQTSDSEKSESSEVTTSRATRQRKNSSVTEPEISEEKSLPVIRDILRTSSTSSIRTCSVCYKKFPDQARLDGHVTDVHGRPNVQTKQSPGRLVNKQSGLKTQRDLRSPRNKQIGTVMSHACPVCDRKFPYKANVSNHMKAKHPSSWKAKSPDAAKRTTVNKKIHFTKYSHKCRDCSLSFTNKTLFLTHRRTHIRHLVNKHGISPVRKQIKIENPSNNEDNLKRKIVQVKQVSALHTKTCPVCKKDFSSEPNCTRHFNVAHCSATPYPCKLCDKRFKIHEYIKKHIQLEHPGETFTIEVDHSNEEEDGSSNNEKHLLDRTPESDPSPSVSANKENATLTKKNIFELMTALASPRADDEMSDVSSLMSAESVTSSASKYRKRKVKPVYGVRHNYKCSYCSECFTSKTARARHVEAHENQ